MRFWKTKPKTTQAAARQVDGKILGSSELDPRSSFMPGYLRLEQRTLLSATFMTFGTTELALGDFDVGQNLNLAQQDADVNGVMQDSFVFTVDSGSFTGSTADPLFELESVNGGVDNQLEVATAFFQGAAANADLTIDGLSGTGAAVEFTQTSPTLMFDTLQISNFANDNRDFNLMAIGDVTLDNVTVFDGNPTGGLTTPAALNVSVAGDLNLSGLTGNLSADPDANVDLSATGNISMASGAELVSEQDISVSSITGSVTLADISAGDQVQVNAANDIAQRVSTEIISGSGVNLSSTNGSIMLADITAGNDVRAQAFSNIIHQANSEIEAGGSVDFVSSNGSITLAGISTGDDLQIQASNDIMQQTGSDIVVETTATVSSMSGDILLAAAPDQTIDIQGQANFSATQIEIGLDGENVGSPTATNVQLGTVSLNASRAVLVEDDATRLTGDSNVTDLFVSAALDIDNTAGASLAATNAQLNSATDIVLGNQAGDSVLLGEVGLIADNAHLEVDGDLSINGVKPVATNSLPIALGTNVNQTLYVIADGSVEQTQGDLCATQIGIVATEYVHLTSVAAANEAIAISAGGSTLLTDPSLSSALNSLATVENGEVDATRPQAISVAHRGDAVVTDVTSVTGIDSLTGFSSTEGSISVFADQSISLQQDITAFSSTADPQVTLFSAAGDGNNPAIFFDGGQASVTGPTNLGIVNSNQVFVNFFDTDGFLFDNTTTILTLNPDGTVSQDIEIAYGNPGEAGYRVGIVYDSQNLPGAPVEDLNLFTPSNTVASEAFEDPIFQENTVIRLLIGGNEGGREVFSKVEDFSAVAVIDTFDNPNVFSDITVRNDQDINLFSGSLDSVDNSLNENIQRLLQAEFDLPRGGAVPLPAINMINSIEVRTTFDLPFESPTPLDQTRSIFERDIAPFESGELRWVQVEIPIDDLEMVGDEVVLKQPTVVYPAVDDAAEMTFENVGENETERIANQIEQSPAAEPGYWYRIFKAYENRNDELIFYYYKTGEVDSVPAETLDGTDTLPAEEVLENNNNDDETPGPDTLEPAPERENGNDDVSSRPDFSQNDSPSTSIAASSILLGLLRREAKRNDVAESPNQSDASASIKGDPEIGDPKIGDPETSDSTIGVCDTEKFAQTATDQSYDRISRLKRKLKRCL